MISRRATYAWFSASQKTEVQLNPAPFERQRLYQEIEQSTNQRQLQCDKGNYSTDK
jgi:hypothetical protein